MPLTERPAARIEGRTLMEQTQYRGFDPDLDARPVMYSQFLRPGEEVLFAVGVSPANTARHRLRQSGRRGASWGAQTGSMS
jgi:hypothetical protein